MVQASQLRAEFSRAHRAQLSGIPRRLYSWALAERWSKGRLAMAEDQGRRAFLRWAAAAGGAGLLASCSRASGTTAAVSRASGSAGTSGATAGGAARAAAVPAATRSPGPADSTALGRDLSRPLVRPG